MRRLITSTRAVLILLIASALAAPASCARNDGEGGSSSTSGSVHARELTLAQGAVVVLRSATDVSTRTSHAGDPVRATAVAASVSEHGDTIIPSGAEFVGTVTTAVPGKPNKPGALQLAFSQVRWGGHSYPVHARVTSMSSHTAGRGVTGGTAAKVGAGAVAGAIAGRIIGGNRTGTIVGGAAGAAAGGVVAHETRDIDIVMPAGSTIRVSLTQPFTADMASNR